MNKKEKTTIKATDYFDPDKNILRLGDVIEISGSVNNEKDGKYIILSDRKCGTWLRSMLPLGVKKTTETNDKGEEEVYHYLAGWATQGLQADDEDTTFVRVIGNILEDYKGRSKANNLTSKTMKITNLAKKLLDKKIRDLIETGYIDGDLELTEEGKEALLSILFLEKKDELVKLAEEKIKDEERK